jgi:energy-coupling factor transporter ATP-binding protein EcfA2
MQLLSITLYHADGRTRSVDFRPGELNIITGQSQTGKSALLTIVEYCLGRDTMLVPVGPIADTVAWYAALWQLDHGRAFVARPAPARGKASTSLAMLEFGVDLLPPPLSQLKVNTDSRSLREQLGRRIGIEENFTEPGPGSLRQPLEANIGHAALLCLQGQNEIANATAMFHRQGEQGIDQALRDTIPYFLGAVPRDQALKRAQLRDAKRTMARLAGELDRAELIAQTIDVELGALLAEARAVGLVDDREVSDRSELVRVLQGARTARPTVRTGDVLADQDRRLELERRRDQIRAQLRRVMDERALLLAESTAAGGFETALGQQQSRLTALNLLPDFQPTGNAAEVDSNTTRGDSPVAHDNQTALDVEACPVCGQHLDEPDPTARALSTSLADLRAQVGDIAGARPAQRRAIQELDTSAQRLRAELGVAQGALEDLMRGDRVSENTAADTRDFTRGRIDATLSRATLTDDVQLEVLRQQRARARASVEALEAELDDDNDREQLTSRLFAVGRDMSAYAERLNLEHSADGVRLDLARLTVVTDTPTGPVPLSRIGSAANWVGYHLVAHLALHRYLTTQNRPVPRLLILDQPTQAHYPSESDNVSGEPEADADRIAVRAMFELMRDVVQELAPDFQVIVCDHADLPEQWFQDAVRRRWRGGEKLIPAAWFTAQ